MFNEHNGWNKPSPLKTTPGDGSKVQVVLHRLSRKWCFCGIAYIFIKWNKPHHVPRKIVQHCVTFLQASSVRLMVSYFFLAMPVRPHIKGKGPMFCLIKSPKLKKKTTGCRLGTLFAFIKTPVLFLNSRFSDSIPMSFHRFISILLRFNLNLFGWILIGNGGFILYPLVNLQKAMENHHAIHGKIHYFYGHFQWLFWHNQRVAERRWRFNPACASCVHPHMNPISPSYHHVKNWWNPLKSHPHWWNPINLQPLFPHV